MERALALDFAAEGGRRWLELRELREQFVEERARIIGDERSRAAHWICAERGDGKRRDRGAANRPDLAGHSPQAQHIRLQAIERALQQLAVGQYGACIACLRPISLTRLRAAPAVGCCSRCAALAGGEPGSAARPY